jgi:hypothetical protein
MTHDDKQALLDRLAIERAELLADMAEREAREADPLYFSVEWRGALEDKQTITKDASGPGVIRKVKDDAWVPPTEAKTDLRCGISEDELAAAVSLGDVLRGFNMILDVVGSETTRSDKLLKRALEDQIAELSDRIAVLEDRVAELEAGRLEGGGNGG